MYIVVTDKGVLNSTGGDGTYGMKREDAARKAAQWRLNGVDARIQKVGLR